MQLPAAYPYGLTPRPRRAAPRWVCLVLAVCWALAGAALAVAVFRSWMQPPPRVNPALDGPVPANSNLSAWLGAYLMAFLLGGFWAGATVTGASYLRGAARAGRWRTCWGCAVTVAGALQVMFIAVYADPVPIFGPMVLGQAHWGMLAVAAAFITVGVAIVAVITGAARQAAATTTESS